MTEASISLVVRRTIRATPERIFAAWTTPEQLTQWWGPADVECPSAEVDLRVGGRYRLENRTPDGGVVFISGEFVRITPPRELVYTWTLEPASGPAEQVTVRFDPVDGGTEVVVIHERIGSEPARVSHERGWHGCLDGLAALLGD